MAVFQPNGMSDQVRTKDLPGSGPMHHSKKKVRATIKTKDGQLLVGCLFFRSCNLSIKEELNGDVENFIAVTDVLDGKGSTIPFTFLVNFSQIIYVAVHEELEGLKDFAFEKHSYAVPRRKVEAYVRTVDGKNMTGNLHVRNTVSSTKDELNSREGSFILLSDVKAGQGSVVSEVYFINKEHVVYFAVGNDRLS